MTSYRRQVRNFGHHYELETDEKIARRNQRTRRKSISGKPSMKRDQFSMSKNEYFSMSKNEYLHRMGALVISTALFIGAGNLAFNQIRDLIVRNEAKIEFQADYISPETHRTDDGKYYFYDYEDIADRMKESEDFDEAVYLLYSNVGENQTSLVLEHTDYGSFQSYLEQRNYENVEDFKKDMEKRIIINLEMDEKEEELRRMAEEHPNTEIMGGKSL